MMKKVKEGNSTKEIPRFLLIKKDQDFVHRN